MGWKLRKDKLRAETDDASQPPADPVADTDTAAIAAEKMPAAEDVSLNPLPHETQESPAFEVPIDLDEQAEARHAEPIVLDVPPASRDAASEGGEPGDSPESDPLSFAPSSDLDDAPVFGVDSVFVPEDDEDTPMFAPMSAAFDPLPGDAADALAMPLSGPEPIVAGGDTESTFGAFAPYQPESSRPEEATDALDPTGGEAYSDPDLEVGASAFDPQSAAFGTFEPEAPTAGEEIAQETTAPAFADPSDTSPLAFEPAFEAPDALAGEVREAGGDDGDEPFMDREALAAGLVTMEPSSGLPRVAPFVLAGTENPAFDDDQVGPHTLVLRLGSLSATYPLTKPVTTIGRPDGEIGTYPDIEVELDDGVSRRHAEVRQEGDNIYLVDLGSTNGTILNGEMLTANQPARLMRGDRIRIGERVEIVFE